MQIDLNSMLLGMALGGVIVGLAVALVIMKMKDVKK
jgi:hypothetical protein